MEDPFNTPVLAPLFEPPGGTWVQDIYIIRLKDGHSKDDHFSWLRPLLDRHESEITHGDWHPDAFHGYAAALKHRLVQELRTRSDVEYVQKDVESRDDCDHDYTTQKDAPWGLSRLSSDTLSSKDDTKVDFEYIYHSSAGRAVNIYILDSAVKTDHEDFEGRASLGPAFDTHAENIDWSGNGHATHCAAIAAGKRWGVAKRANIISIKIAHNHHRSARHIMAGVNYVISEAKKDKYERRIISYSAGRGPDPSIDETFRNAVRAGIHVVAAAGNDGVDAKDTSPAYLDCVITVGNSNIDDERDSSSNYGNCVDIWAPGHNIESAWVSTSSKNATERCSGTSMATPHVAGILACMIASSCWHYSPGQLKDELIERSRKNKLSDIKDSPNRLALQRHE